MRVARHVHLHLAARRRLEATGAPGPSPLDVTSATILNFAQGSFALVERDVAALCAGDAAADGAARAVLALAGVADAFCARRELVAAPAT